jgi:streptogramin lyase
VAGPNAGRQLCALTLALLGCLLAFHASIASAEEVPLLTHYSVAGTPTEVAQGPSGELWFTEDFQGTNVNEVPQAGPSVASTKSFGVTLPSNHAEPEYATEIVAGANKTLWFLIPNFGSGLPATDPGVGEIDAGASPAKITEYSLPHVDEPVLLGMAAGPEATIFYGDAAHDDIDWFDQSKPEEVHEIPLSSAGVLTHPSKIAESPDGSMWVEMDGSSTPKNLGGVVHIVQPTSADPTIVESVLADEGKANEEGKLNGGGLAVDCSGNVWVSGGTDYVIDEFHPASSTVTAFPLELDPNAGLPGEITLAPDQSVWFGESEVGGGNGTGLTNLLPSAAEPFSFLPVPTADEAKGAGGLITGSDGNLWMSDLKGIDKITLPKAAMQAPTSCTGVGIAPSESNGGGGKSGGGQTNGTGNTGAGNTSASTTSTVTTTTIATSTVIDQAEQASLTKLTLHLLGSLSKATIARLLAQNGGVFAEIPTSYGGAYEFVAKTSAPAADAGVGFADTAKRAPVVVFRYAHTFPAASKDPRVHIPLTSAGRKLLEREQSKHHSLTLTFTITYKASGHATAHSAFKLALKP